MFCVVLCPVLLLAFAYLWMWRTGTVAQPPADSNALMAADVLPLWKALGSNELALVSNGACNNYSNTHTRHSTLRSVGLLAT